MYMILIVDDAKRIRQRMRRLIEDQLNEQISVYEACDGEEALIICRTLSFDVVITDIHMENIDGIDFLTELRTQNTETVFIVVSGYDNFEYAQRSIECGVRKYLLKPLDDAEFVSSVRSALDEIRQKRDGSDFAQAYQRHRQSLQSQQVRALLFGGEYNPADWQKYTGFSNAVYRLLLVDARTSRFYRFPSVDNRDLYSCVVKTAEKFWKHFFALNDDEKRVALLINDAYTITDESIHRFYDQLMISAETDFYERVVVGVSNETDHLPELSRLYHQAATALKEKIVIADNVIFYAEQEKKAMGAQWHLPLNFFEKLKELIELNDKKGINDLIDEMLFPEPFDQYSFSGIQRFCAGLESYFWINLFECNPASWGEDNPREVLRLGLEDSDSVPELCVNLKRNCYRLCDLYSESRINEDAAEAIIIKAQNYIEENLTRELTMAEVANYVDVSYAHFSRIFKKVQGMNFVDYLANARIKRAKQFLKNTTMDINEISALLGYRSPRYFSSVFRKITGFPPSEYRQKTQLSLKDVD